MAVFRVRLSAARVPHRFKPGAEPRHAQERKHKVDHRVLSTNPNAKAH